MTIEFLTLHWPVIAGILAALVVLGLLLRQRGQRVTLERDAAAPRATLERVAPAKVVKPALDIAVAVPIPTGEPDDLRRIKGLGPKVAAQLGALGITRFDQLAALDAVSQTAIDRQLGTFAGRMARDRWIEQAALLSRNDVAAFEEQFGKIG